MCGNLCSLSDKDTRVLKWFGHVGGMGEERMIKQFRSSKQKVKG